MERKWFWMMDYCKEHGLAPGEPDVWIRAETAYRKAHGEGHFCKGCGNEIDPECCWCGSRIDLHTWDDGHSPVPMGCTCGYIKPEQDDN